MMLEPGHSDPAGLDAQAYEGELGWKTFVLVQGHGCRARDLAAVLGRPEAEIRRVRDQARGGSPVQRRPQGFAALFEAWHGRPPADEEWPRPAFVKGRGAYEWQQPELTLIATLVGQISVPAIAAALSARLREVTGDPSATRSASSVQNVLCSIGLQAADVIGGVTVRDAGAAVGTTTRIQQALRKGRLTGRKVGQRLVIAREDLEAFQEQLEVPPEGYVALSSLREPMGILSGGKLAEFARMGYIPSAVQVRVNGRQAGDPGLWFVSPGVAKQLLVDRQAGKPMPWAGRPQLSNLKASWKLFQERRHPESCETCCNLWGDGGAPLDFAGFAARYPGLAHGAKRHLTMKWTPGLTLDEAASRAGRSMSDVRTALRNGALVATLRDGQMFLSKSDVARWIARKCPLGDGRGSWISIEDAVEQYGFSRDEFKGFIERDEIESQIGMEGETLGRLYLARQQCVSLRDRIGYTEVHAAARLKITIDELRALLDGVHWRSSGRIPMSTLQAVQKRMQSCHGHTVEEAAALLGVTVDWVQARVQDGTATLKRNSWGGRPYFAEPMLQALKAAVGVEPKRALGEEWLSLSPAAALAGVSTGTVMKWGEGALVRREASDRGWRYHVEDLRQQARIHWSQTRYKRDKRPQWLIVESHRGLDATLDGETKPLACTL